MMMMLIMAPAPQQQQLLLPLLPKRLGNREPNLLRGDAARDIFFSRVSGFPNFPHIPQENGDNQSQSRFVWQDVLPLSWSYLVLI